MQKKINAVLLAVVIALPLIFLSGYLIGMASPGSTLVWEHPAGDYSYLIWQEDSTYYAKNGFTGNVDYSNANRSIVINSCMSALSNGGTIVLNEVTKPAYSTYTHAANVTIIEHYKGEIREFTSVGMKFGPLASRVGNNALTHYDSNNGSYVCKVGSVAGNSFYSLWTVGQTFDYGTYQWNGSVFGTSSDMNQIFGFEYLHGFAGEGLISFECLEGGCKVKSAWGGSAEQTSLGGEDWTSEMIFKVEWTSTSVKYYVDGVLKDTDTTYVPQAAMCIFIEAYSGSSTPADWFGCKIRLFEEIIA